MYLHLLCIISPLPKESENMHAPEYLVLYVLGGTLATIAAVLFGVERALKLARWPQRESRRAVWICAVLLVTWFVAALAPSLLGFYRGAFFHAPTIQYGLLIPIFAGIALFWRWSTLRRVIEAVPQEWIVGVQIYRTLGAIFLVLYAAGRLPGVFAGPAGVGDVIVGLLAPAVAIAYARRSRGATALVGAWNLLGLADLFVAVATGFLTSPSPLQLLALDAPNQLISEFPLVLIPVFLVPLSVLLHLASLRKLQGTEVITQAGILSPQSGTGDARQAG
jgi:hypothetical protein